MRVLPPGTVIPNLRRRPNPFPWLVALFLIAVAILANHLAAYLDR